MSTTNKTDNALPPHSPSHGDASRCDLTPASEDQDAETNASSLPSHQHQPSSNLLTGDGVDGNANNSKREPIITLAVAADVAQAAIPESASQNNHARGDAVAQHLQSMLSHISSNDRIMSLKSELNDPATAATKQETTDDSSVRRGSTKNDDEAEQLGSWDAARLWGGLKLQSSPSPISSNDRNNYYPAAAETKHETTNDSAVIRGSAKNDDECEAELLDDEKMAESSPPSPQKEFVFKRMMHAIDNYLHPPSKLLPHVPFTPPHHHQQGHRINSMHSATASNHDCTVNCLPNSQLQHEQQQQNNNTTQSQQQQQHNDKTQQSVPTHSSRRLPTLNSLSTAVASAFTSNFQTHSHNNTQTAQQPKQPKSFFPFLFHSGSRSQSPNKRMSPRFSGPLLFGTSDHEEHEAVITTALHVCNLYKLGHDVTRYQHSQNGSSGAKVSVAEEEDVGGNISDNGEDECSKEAQDAFDRRARHALSSLGLEFHLDLCQNCCGENGSTEGNTTCKSDGQGDSQRCSECVTRLYHVPSNTAVTADNRRTFIADGKMYDAIGNLCQAAAQEIMAEKCDLVWVTICDGKGGGLRAAHQYPEQHPQQSKPKSNLIEEWPRDEHGTIVIQEPIRALVGRQRNGVDASHPRDTFLVATGKGKVRAGIFSRQHLMTTGLEPSTALPLLREAQDRGMNCVVIDPNARGDRHGMDTFEVSIRGLFEQQSVLKEEEDGDDDDDSTEERTMRAIIPTNVDGSIYVLAHSAAGGQLVRYLLDQQKGAPLLSRIRCITFTDSTHSVQWLKRHPHISSLIQSSNALYVRSANPMRDDDWENALPGDECPRDHFWSHRFGDIKTVWAGTTEHSLSNWTAHKPIWDHFDKIRGQTGITPEDSIAEKGNDSCAGRNGRGNVDSIDNKTDANGTVDSSHNGKSEANEESMNKEHVQHRIGTKPVVI